MPLKVFAMTWAVALVLVSPSGTRAETYDVVQPHRLPPQACFNGCARWDDLAGDGAHDHLLQFVTAFCRHRHCQDNPLPDAEGTILCFAWVATRPFLPYSSC